MENWDQVATDDGYIGYIDKKKVGEAEKTKFERSFNREQYSYLTMDSKINMVWHQVTSTDANAYFADATANMTGVKCDLAYLVLSDRYFRKHCKHRKCRLCITGS